MMKKIYAIIPKHNIIYSLTCLSGILIIILFGIIPQQLSLARLDQKAKNIQFQIDEQKNLYTIYQAFQRDIKTKDSKILPAPVKSSLSRTQLDMISITIKNIASKANLDTVFASPDLNSLGNEPKSLLINIVLRGEFLNFRKFLIGLGELPYLERIEEIHIQQNEDTMEFRMKISLSIT